MAIPSGLPNPYYHVAYYLHSPFHVKRIVCPTDRPKSLHAVRLEQSEPESCPHAMWPSTLRARKTGSLLDPSVSCELPGRTAIAGKWPTRRTALPGHLGRPGRAVLRRERVHFLRAFAYGVQRDAGRAAGSGERSRSQRVQRMRNLRIMKSIGELVQHFSVSKP